MPQKLILTTALSTAMLIPVLTNSHNSLGGYKNVQMAKRKMELEKCPPRKIRNNRGNPENQGGLLLYMFETISMRPRFSS